MSKVVEIYERTDGYRIRHHLVQDCRGERCPFHRPSKHKMVGWPMNLRSDRNNLIERVCPHGIGHPDPDSARFIGDPGIHGCDGCCHGEG